LSFPRLFPVVSLLAVLPSLTCLPGCAIFATRNQEQALEARNTKLEKAAEQSTTEVAALRADLEATRTRLDNALRAHADTSTDVQSERGRVQILQGRIEEVNQAAEQTKRELSALRAEMDARLDELKRGQEVQVAKAPPVVIPGDKAGHFAAVDGAYTKGDWNLTRTLGREYVNRYPEDEKADDVYFQMGDANLKDGHPSSALGDFNRVLKQFPKSNVLGVTLFGMGESYMLLHDCQNAKLAYGAFESRYPKDRLSPAAKQRLAQIAKPQPGTCAP
jgi:TolA-binding protein